MPGIRTTACLILATALGAIALGTAIANQHHPDPAPPPTAVRVRADAILPAQTSGLSLPIDCQVGASCEVQNYVDRDDTSGGSDFRCGTRTYDGHNGVDFRLKDLEAQRQGINVLAAADGVVSRIRNDVADVSVAQTGAGAVAGQECGNGVVIEHPEGLSTQYCHLARASVVVQPGDHVRAGDVLGKVGLSGLTEYPHLHFTVRRAGTVVDPFLPAPTDSCLPGQSLWTAAAAEQLGYRARAVLNAGFSSSPVTMDVVEMGRIDAPDTAGPILVAFVRVLGVKRGDVQTLVVTGPNGAVVAETTSDPVPRDQAQRLLYVGGRSRTGWPGGTYTAFYRTFSGGEVVLEKQFQIVL